MIVRIWRGTTRPEDAERYARYVTETGIAHYLETPGNLGAHLLQRDLGDRVETVTLTFWESLDAIRAFAGDDPTVARYYPEDDAFLLDRPERVEHYDVVESSLRVA
jgi:heme-degrading monooxygenase HmoA